MTLRALFTFALLIAPSLFSANAAKLAIIIDDIGYRATDIEALTLPGNISYAVLPHTPFGKRLAMQAHKANKDVLLHIPMEATNGKKLGPGALTSEMNEANIHRQLSRAFEEIPFAKGINNHMGSRLTQMTEPMTATMRFLKQRDLFFIDSVTTGNSKAERIAKAHGLSSTRRDVFLDNQLSQQYIQGQFEQLIARAKTDNRLVAIAHPHPETIAALKNLLPKLKSANIELVPVSELFVTDSANPTQLAED